LNQKSFTVCSVHLVHNKTPISIIVQQRTAPPAFALPGKSNSGRMAFLKPVHPAPQAGLVDVA
jgi:hypothetical protein